jgi:hypothetical protein
MKTSGSRFLFSIFFNPIATGFESGIREPKQCGSMGIPIPNNEFKLIATNSSGDVKLKENVNYSTKTEVKETKKLPNFWLWAFAAFLAEPTEKPWRDLATVIIKKGRGIT